MLIQRSWRDATVYEAEAGGAGGGDAEKEGGEAATSGEMSPAELKAQLEETRKALKRANSEAAERRKKLEEMDAAEAKRKEAELSETQKAAARAEKAEADMKALQDRHRTSAIKSAIRLAAATANFVDVEDAVLLADVSEVSVGEDDRVIGAAEAVKKLAAAKPHLVKSEKLPVPNINSGAGGTPRAPTAEELAAQRRPTDSIYTPF